MDELDGRTKDSAGFATAQGDANWWLRNGRTSHRGEFGCLGGVQNCRTDAGGEKNREERSDKQISTPKSMQETCFLKKFKGG